MVTDPSWFYSSLAQSGAAVVGVMGAIFIARLVQHLPEVAESRSRLLEEFRGSRIGLRVLSENATKYAGWIDANPSKRRKR